LAAPLACASPPAIDGTWSGVATYRGARLAISVRFRSDRDSLRATFNSPDLMILAQPLTSAAFESPRVRFTTTDDQSVRFEGVVAGDSIVGGATVGTVPGVIAAGDTARMRFSLRRAAEPLSP